ncbi:MAG: transglycosylase domain-containing protein [Oscillospiraceae bacterium]|nr:transglycosylase domain-containing protein [Oscillospiraceae bacterium]
MDMENEKKPRRREKKPRQEWDPHWLLKLLYTLVSVAFSVVKIAIGAAATVLMIIVVCGVVFVGILGDYLQEDILPEAQNWSIEDYGMEETSFLYYVDKNGDIQELQQIYTMMDRQVATLDEIPQALIDAAVAIEDKRFYEHQGVDWITTVKACVNMFFGNGDFGGSTITQQLIKNSTEEKSVTVQRKVMEIFRAQFCEQVNTKDEIMVEYLNRIYLGRGCYGVKSAAAEYFGKELQSLTVAECASLISITNNPSIFNPYSKSVYMWEKEERDGAGRNRCRQLTVLSEMYNQGYLTKAEYDEAVAQEMVFKEGIADQDRWAVCENETCGYQGIVATFRNEGNNHYCPECGNLTPVQTSASQHIYSWFVDAVLIDFASYLAEQDGYEWENLNDSTREVYLERIRTGGYHIYTTLDMDVQEKVDSVYQDLSNIPATRSAQQLQSAIVVIDNRTGDVVALSGGVGEKNDFLAYNRATQARLQTGSSQKPISVYAPAFESGAVSPATVLKDLPVTYSGGNWPKNDNRKYNYARTVFSGIVSSVNTMSVRTLNETGALYAFDFAKYNLGLHNLVESYTAYNGQIQSDIAQAPLALGALTLGVTVREMSAAYATFANNGEYREARLYTKIYNSQGQLVVDNTQDTKQVLSEKTVNYMNYCLYHAANNGTGGAAIFGGQAIAGKTGTTSSNRDRWFCGYTAHYTAAVWCGYDQPEQISLGTNPAAQLWRKVMMPVHQGLPYTGLFNGNAMRSVSVCLDSGKIATAACSNDARGESRVSTAMVYPDDVPYGTCDKHTNVEYCVTGGGVATEYCGKFEDVEITSKALVKLNSAEVSEIKSAMNVGLLATYYDDGYVYYTDGAWHGFKNSYPDNTEPYLCCTVHTKEAWEKYQKEKEEQEKAEQDKQEQEGGETTPEAPAETTPPAPEAGGEADE